ncbi:hypothetical protein Ddc_14750 [Ditylenchus destructor]|nr:hypothetical protein Ddc_14750 [Ditylenchus destructor]
MSRIVFIFAAIAFLTAYATAHELLNTALHVGSDIYWIGINCDPNTHTTTGDHIWKKATEEMDGREIKIRNIIATYNAIGSEQLVADLRRHKINCNGLALYANQN